MKALGLLYCIYSNHKKSNPLPENEFYKSPTNKSGFQHVCIECFKNKNAAYYQKRRNEFRDAKKRNITMWKYFFLTKYSNPFCEGCGKNLDWFSKNKNFTPCWDHSKGESFIKSPSEWMANNEPTKDKINTFLKEDFGILCRGCNAALPTDIKKRKSLIKYAVNKINKIEGDEKWLD